MVTLLCFKHTNGLWIVAAYGQGYNVTKKFLYEDDALDFRAVLKSEIVS